MSEENNFLIIDANNISLRALHGCAPLYDKQGFPTACLMTTIRTIYRVANIVRPTRTLCVWDAGHAEFRKKIFPDYKKRDPLAEGDPKLAMLEEWKEQCVKLQEYLPLLGVGQVKIAGCEADDVIFRTMQILEGAEYGVVLATTDQDFMQVLKPGRAIFHVGREEIIEEQDVFNEYGIDVAQWVDYRAMTGDKSDNINGVRGIGTKKAADILKNFHSIAEFFQHINRTDFIESKQAKSHHKALAASKAIVTRNQCLMDFERIPAGTMPIKELESQLTAALDLEPNPDAFSDACFEHQLNTIIQESTLWHTVFGGQ